MNSASKPDVYVIVGPTASGKTAYGIDLANKINGAVVSADSRQIYAGMNIGTAKPQEAWQDKNHDILTPETVEGIDHYLFNITTPDNPLTLPYWQAGAMQTLSCLASQAIKPIVVGGTMLYIDSLVKNYYIPETPPNIKLRSTMAQKSADELYQRLLKKDPEAKKFVEPHNKQRIIRALEVIQTTNKPFSSQRKTVPSLYNFEVLGLFPGWSVLQKNIIQRHTAMLKKGLLEETEKLQKKYGIKAPLLSTMNYKQAADILAGRKKFNEALDETIRVNMRYARRQMSWWKNRKDIKWTDG